MGNTGINQLAGAVGSELNKDHCLDMDHVNVNLTLTSFRSKVGLGNNSITIINREKNSR